MGDLIQFLRGRGLPACYIQKLIDEKIDIEVLVLMDDNSMKSYIPSYGDRLAAVAYCQSKTKEGDDRSSTTEDVLSNAMDRLKERIGRRKRKPLLGEKTPTNSNNGRDHARPKKPTRRVELGWMDFCPTTTSYRQVRTQNGGGTRHLEVERDFGVDVIVPIATGIFFPDGISKKGKVEDFSFILKDFLMEDVGQRTIGEMYDKTKVKLLRLYMCSKKLEDVDEKLQEQSGNNAQAQDRPDEPSFRDSKTDAGIKRRCDSNEQSTLVNRSGVEEVVDSDDEDGGESPPAPLSREENDEFVSVAHCSGETSPRDWNISSWSPTRAPLSSGTPTISFRRPTRNLRLQRSMGLPPTLSKPHIDTQTIQSTTTSTSCPTVSMETSATTSEPVTEMVLSNEAHSSLENDSDPIPLEDLLNQWMSGLKTDECQLTLIIQRKKLFQSTRREINRKSFSFFAPVNVVFAEEIGEDLGGPKREFFRELMKCLVTRYFEGVPGRMIFRHDIAALEADDYSLAGKLVAWSLLNEGPGLPILEENIYRLLCQQAVDDMSESIQALPDEDFKTMVIQISNCSSWTDINSDEKLMEFLFDNGVTVLPRRKEESQSFSTQDKKALLTACLKNYMYYRTFAEMKQFSHGLNAFGKFGDMLENFSSTLKPLFVNVDSPMTFDSMRALITVVFSEANSTRKMEEEDTIYCWNTFLRDTAEGDTDITLEQVLSFWTGADKIPPTGFNKKLEIHFITGADRLPVAHTCGMILELARGIDDADSFREMMVKAVRWSEGFDII